MALDAGDVVTTARQVLSLRDGEQRRLTRIANYMAGNHTSVYVPRGARAEYRWLIKRAKVNVLPLVPTVVAQNLRVDGYRAAKSTDNAAAWDTWQDNRMDARQHGVHRSALTYGASYVTVMPGKPKPVMRPVSPRNMTALYADPVDDEWPELAVEELIQQAPAGPVQVVYLYDNTSRFTLKGNAKQPNTNLVLTNVESHGLGVCPVVRFVNEVDLDGVANIAGEIERLIDLQDQLNFSTFNLMMAQQYAAFRQRWVTGMVPDTDENGVAKEPFQSGVDRLFVAEKSDTKFGEFGETDLTGYIKSREETIKHMAMISQTPPHYLLGQMVNLSAEALVAAESGLYRKIVERQATFGEAWEQTLRLAAKADNDTTGWEDTSAQVVWRDTEARSLAQTADALGKLATMLAVPKTELWERIPGVTQQDVERWKAAAQEGNALGALNAMIERQMNTEVAPTLRQTFTDTTTNSNSTTGATPAKALPAKAGPIKAAPVTPPPTS